MSGFNLILRGVCFHHFGLPWATILLFFYLLWCWHLLFSSFSLLVLFVQLRCQADKQGKLCKWCLRRTLTGWKKKQREKKLLWQYLAKAGWFKKKSISFYQLTSEPCTGSPITQQLFSFAPQAKDMKHRLEALRSVLSQEQPILAHQGYQQNTTTTSLLAKQTNVGNGHSYLGTCWGLRRIVVNFIMFGLNPLVCSLFNPLGIKGALEPHSPPPQNPTVYFNFIISSLPQSTSRAPDL